MFPVDHSGGFRRIPELSNSTVSVYRLERFTGISDQYNIWEVVVSTKNRSMIWDNIASSPNYVNQRHGIATILHRIFSYSHLELMILLWVRKFPFRN